MRWMEAINVRFGVALEGTISVARDDGKPAENPDALIEAHLDDVMDELLGLDAGDATISVDLEDDDNKLVKLSVVVESSNQVEAVEKASGVIRTAIHAAGGGTPDWPVPYDGAWAVRLIRVESAELVPA